MCGDGDMDMDDFVGCFGLIAVDGECKRYADGLYLRQACWKAYQLTSTLCQNRSVGEISLALFLDSCEGTTTANTTNIQQSQPHTVNDSQFAK